MGNIKDKELPVDWIQVRKPTVEQFTGCIIGQCIGDALGLLVEGEGAKGCEKLVAELQECVKQSKVCQSISERAAAKNISVGQYSDDSQLARELLLSLIECETFDGENYANRIAELVKSSKIVGCGKATAKAAARLNRGVDWKNSGMKVGDAGNGTAPRATPLGLLFYNNPQQMIKFACDQSQITHKDPRCMAGAVAIAGGVSLCLQHKDLDDSQFIFELVALTEPVSKEFSQHLKSLDSLLKLKPSQAAKKIAKLGQDFDDGSTGISGFVTSSVVWSIYSFLLNKHNFMDNLFTAIAAGGDTDSTAAMAGALSGAYLGIDMLPKYFVETVNDKSEWNHELLTSSAHKLYSLCNKLKT